MFLGFASISKVAAYDGTCLEVHEHTAIEVVSEIEPRAEICTKCGTTVYRYLETEFVDYVPGDCTHGGVAEDTYALYNLYDVTECECGKGRVYREKRLVLKQCNN